MPLSTREDKKEVFFLLIALIFYWLKFKFGVDFKYELVFCAQVGVSCNSLQLVKVTKLFDSIQYYFIIDLSNKVLESKVPNH